jgi:hypothetical protein
MSRKDLEKAKEMEREAAIAYHKKEAASYLLKAIPFIDLSSFISKVVRMVRYTRHQGEREKARRLRQFPSLDIKRIGH